MMEKKEILVGFLCTHTHTQTHVHRTNRQTLTHIWLWFCLSAHCYLDVLCWQSCLWLFFFYLHIHLYTLGMEIIHGERNGHARGHCDDQVEETVASRMLEWMTEKQRSFLILIDVEQNLVRTRNIRTKLMCESHPMRPVNCTIHGRPSISRFIVGDAPYY